MTEQQHPLIDASTLRDRLAQQPGTTVVFDCRFWLDDPSRGQREYREGHIPGARYAHLDDDLSRPITPETGRHPLPDPQAFRRFLRQAGVTDATLVVAYDQAGGMIAARLWWMLRWLGHPRVALLDGGLNAWSAAGGQLTDAIPPVAEPSPSAVFKVRPDDACWLTTAEVRRLFKTKDRLIIDARAHERFTGEQETVDPVGGHIPGAVNLPCDGNLTDDGCFLPADQLRERFTRAIGDRAVDAVIHSCGSGVTACHNQLAMELAGLHGSRVYPGSWSEWIRSEERPVATGED